MVARKGRYSIPMILKKIGDRERTRIELRFRSFVVSVLVARFHFKFIRKSLYLFSFGNVRSDKMNTFNHTMNDGVSKGGFNF